MNWIEAIGWTGQALFTGRVLLQWVSSERAKRSLVPRGYWQISLVASALVLSYAVLVNNLVFQLSVIPGAIIAARNLFIRRSSAARKLVPWAVLLVALVVWATLLKPRVGPAHWAAVGLLGSALWGFRFVFQWWRSERSGASTLPGVFWILSLAGGALLLAYAIAWGNAVMIAGYAFGCVPYVRNLMLLRRQAPPHDGGEKFVRNTISRCPTRPTSVM